MLKVADGIFVKRSGLREQGWPPWLTTAGIGAGAGLIGGKLMQRAMGKKKKKKEKPEQSATAGAKEAVK